jgi:hypothetical protein
MMMMMMRRRRRVMIMMMMMIMNRMKEGWMDQWMYDYCIQNHAIKDLFLKLIEIALHYYIESTVLLS